MTGANGIDDPDVDYITGGVAQGRSKYVALAYSTGLHRIRREPMVDFLTAIPAPLRRAVREHSQHTGESIRDVTARGLRLALVHPEMEVEL